MKKRLLMCVALSLAMTSLVTGCGNKQPSIPETEASKFEKIETDLHVGMVTDSGSIDDRSFNQGAWEGIKGAVTHSKYLEPNGNTTADFLTSIANLVDAGYQLIVTPGFTFEEAVHEAQQRYPEVNFLLLDGIPTNTKGQQHIAENTTCIAFTEHEASFLAGVAAAVELKEGEFGFIGGVEVPAVQKLNWGFQQGIAYANANLGTQITIKPEHVIYQGTFNDMAAGQQMASQLYDQGVDVILIAAGGTGVGAITEAKARAAKGDQVWTIGVDVDQYQEGLYENGQSVMLTSAMKYLDEATYTTIRDEVQGNFKGGQSLVFSVANHGVGLPTQNPNLSEETLKTVEAVKKQIQSGAIQVAGSNDQGIWIK